MDNNFDPIFQTAGADNGVDPLWLKAQAMAESDLDPTKVNAETGATGISQIIPDTAQRLGVDPKDPDASIHGQARLMAENKKRYGSIEQATLAYHGGTDQSNWGPKTKAYLAKVSQNYAQLKEKNTMVDPADQFLETDTAAAPKVDQGVEDFLNSDTTMGPPKADAPAAQTPAAAAAQPASPDGQPAASAEVPTTGKVPQKTPQVLKAMQYLQGPKSGGIMGLKKEDPEAFAAYNDYLHKSDMNALSELGTGVMDVPTSIAKVGMNAGDLIHDHITNRGEKPSNYGDVMDQYIKTRNAMYDADYGSDPNQGLFRGAGQMVGSAPAFGAAGMGANALRTAAPALNPVMDFIGGATPRASEEGASLIGKAGQYIKGLGSKATAGVVGGEGVTALTNAGSNDSYNEQRKSNDLFGAGLGVGGSVVKDVAKGVGTVSKNAYNSLTGAHLKDIPAKAVDTFASNPIDTAAMDTKEIVPGSTPSLAAATQDPGVAELQRQLENTDPSLVKLKQDNNAARAAHIETAAGTPDDVEALMSARDQQRAADTDTLWKPGQKADPAPVLSTIDSILDGPSGKRPAVAGSLGAVRDLIESKDKDGNLVKETDPETLYQSVRKAIGDMMDKTNPNSKGGQYAKSQLMQVQAALDDSIDKAAPGFKNYMDNYAKASSQIDGMQYLQGLKLQDTNGNYTLAKVNKAVDNIDKLKAAPGLNKAKHVTDEQYQKLKDVQADLQRDNIMNSSLPRNSATEFNRKGTVKLNNMMPGTHDPMTGKLSQEAVGAGIGGLVGAFAGFPKTGVVLGDMLGRAGAKADSARSAAIKNELGLTLANPGRYQPSASGAFKTSVPEKDTLLPRTIPHITITKNALTGSGGGQ